MAKLLGIIVDGPGDFAALNTRFNENCRIIKTDGPRGHSVGIEKIVSSSKKQVELLGNLGCEIVLIVTDFEERTQSYDDFLEELRAAFQKVALRIPVLVAMPNQMIENWYLADIEYLSQRRGFLKPHLKQRNFEGRNGKKVLKGFFRKGITYNEVKHGPELFKTIRFLIARANSSSFREFYDIVQRGIETTTSPLGLRNS